MSHIRAALPAFAALAVLAGCAGPAPGPAAPGARVYAIDLQGGAKACKASAVTPEAGKTVAAKIRVGNSGGWCAIAVSQGSKDAPEPYAAGLLTARPLHGRVYIHTVGSATRIDYTPNAGYAGPDRFAVSLLPGGAGIDAQVTVTR
ncbi:MAG: hypothetical protein KGI51_07515 [Rhodospirillales bacterium]|nr:hypothetical protein [Rhodospirillales bacterium]